MKKKLTTYIAAAPSHIAKLPGNQKTNFMEFRKWLSEKTTLIPWAAHPFWWEPLPKEQSRSYTQELNIIREVRLLLALYPTTDGSDRRAVGVIERLVTGSPILVAFHKDARPSKFLESMYQSYTKRPYILFENFTDLQPHIEERLREITDSDF
jgi:hypothetical protein